MQIYIYTNYLEGYWYQLSLLLLNNQLNCHIFPYRVLTICDYYGHLTATLDRK